MLKISHLNKSIGTKPLLKDIQLNVDEGMIYGFIGHNGAGKTTTMRAIVGLTKFDSGEITIDGTIFQNKVTIHDIVGYLPENPSFYDYMTATEYLSFLNPADDKSQIHEHIELVGLKKTTNKRIGSYSRGMKQRLGMASAMLKQPKLLILDEPTSALDPAGRIELFEIIQSLRDKGTTIILSTHILDDIEKVSDCIGMIKEGELLKEGNVEDILSNYVHPIYDIKLEHPTNHVDVNFFLNHEWITEVKTDGSLLSITVNDISEAKKQIMQTLLASQLSVTAFNLRQPSLEEVFMKELRL